MGADRLASTLARPARFKRSHPVVLLRLAAGGGRPRVGPAVEDRAPVGTTPPIPGRRSGRWPWTTTWSGGVYRIDGWDPTGAPSDPATRYTLRGEPDPELEKRYRGRSVAPTGGRGPSRPVTYVWCGPHWVNRPR